MEIDDITDLFKQLNSKTLTTLNAGEDENSKSHSLLVRIQNSIATLEDMVAVSYKANT